MSNVTPNVQSIAQAQFHPKAISRAMVVGEEMVGYTMYGEDDDDSDSWAIDRFMIAQPYRRRGLGEAGLNQIIELGKVRGFRRFITSTATQNLPMQRLLHRTGFETNHEVRDGEYLYSREITLENSSVDLRSDDSG